MKQEQRASTSAGSIAPYPTESCARASTTRSWHATKSSLKLHCSLAATKAFKIFKVWGAPNQAPFRAQRVSASALHPASHFVSSYLEVVVDTNGRTVVEPSDLMRRSLSTLAVVLLSIQVWGASSVRITGIRTPSGLRGSQELTE
jgi:hypothetical protein